MARLSYSVPNKVLGFYKRTKLRELMDEFMESGADVAEVLFSEGEYANVESLRNVLNKHIQQRKLPIMVTIRENHVYIGRKEI